MWYKLEAILEDFEIVIIKNVFLPKKQKKIPGSFLLFDNIYCLSYCSSEQNHFSQVIIQKKLRETNNYNNLYGKKVIQIGM